MSIPVTSVSVSLPVTHGMLDVGIRRDLGLLHSDIAVTHKRLDHHDERMVRIERRLEVS